MISSGNSRDPRAEAGRGQRGHWTRGRSLLGLQTDRRSHRAGSLRRIGPPVVPPHKVLIYKEHHSVCPLVGIGTLQPFSRQRVCAPPPGSKGGARSPAGGGGGGGVPIPTTGEKA
jgi:hypothetical protein